MKTALLKRLAQLEDADIRQTSPWGVDLATLPTPALLELRGILQSPHPTDAQRERFKQLLEAAP